MITIFDYGAGNLRSVQNTLAEIGATYQLVRDAEGLRQASKIILPGVGHFGQMLRALDDLGVRDTLRERIQAGVPFLGICLGLQGLFENSEEAPEVQGLGLFKGTVKRFPLDARVPHMGWNEINPLHDCPLLDRSWSAPLSLLCPQLLCAANRSNCRDLHLHVTLHCRITVRQRLRSAISSREVRSGGSEDSE